MAVYRAVFSGTFASGQTWSWRNHFETSSNIATLASDLDTQIASAWTNGTHGLEAVYPTGTELTQINIAELNGNPYREGVFTLVTETLAGTKTTDSVPEQDCILVSWSNGERGGKNRGRSHLPGPAEDLATGGLMSDATATRVSTAMNAFLAGINTAGHNLIVYNVTTSAHDPVVQTAKVMQVARVDKVLRTQRRRADEKPAVYA